MHIPDGYLSPQTCLTLGAAMIPVWATAATKLKKTLKEKQVPLLAIGAAFSFTIMMYNVPIPDGTTAHAVGATLMAITLGPWAATVGVTIALIIQAFFFGDGGILAIGANTFNMAFVMPLVGYYIYRLISGNSEVTSSRRVVAAVIAGYVSINIAALVAGFEFGIQPTLFHAADGTPLYAPYTLGQALPAMAFAHMLIAGPIEGVVTGLVVKYLQSANPGLLQMYPVRTSTDAAPGTAPSYKKLWYGLIGLMIFAPLGLLASGTAWGEWSGEEMQGLLGFIPQGMAKYADIWTAALPDYSIPGFEGTFMQSALAYIVSAIVGLLLILLITSLIGWWQKRNVKSTQPASK
ncbi:cobalt transporter CbiM [Candidatus Formimonas warabiya]|uniref:Cobalamin biosynthesis protein CbiM n=1 Tax=Formimonas warabiya TaxID=1761012 RepID=A0A3G1KYM8_FORW1|nr:cobalt transporter CbiM [Candidatus Formimonas warabiya]ATW27594.1 cobalamin biosynthesis protein CbiM [Candidatus Formimonas warabiya]